MRSATCARRNGWLARYISIHALHAERDEKGYEARGIRNYISIHALHAERDSKTL